MKLVQDAAQFVKRVHKSMRRGELSREPLTVLRLEWRSDFVGCDWLMRPVDQWDSALPPHLVSESQTTQAFSDALSLRALILEAFPAVSHANLRMFRADSNHRLELMMEGNVNRMEWDYRNVLSAAMRAKLCGFKFILSDGVLASQIASGCHSPATDKGP